MTPVYQEQDINFRKIDGYILRRQDPYGYWHVFDEKGGLAKEFKNQSFTDTHFAVNAIKTLKKTSKEK